MTVYVDVVAAMNFAVDFLLLLGTNRLAGFSPDFGRCAAAAALGGLYGGACLLPSLRFLGAFPWPLVFLGLMLSLAFGWNRTTLQRGGVFLLLSMALGGIAVGIGRGSGRVLIPAALLLWLLCAVGFRGGFGRREYVQVRLCWEDRHLQLIALKDTGNTLCDPVTGEQVLVAGADVGEKLLGLTPHQLRHPVETLAASKLLGLRLIPYRAVGQPGSMLLAVRFPNARIGKRKARPLVAFAPEKLAGGDVYQMLTGGTI